MEAESRWECGRCGETLGEALVEVRYLGNVFSLPLLTCPTCGAALVNEGIALQKMAEAEKILEDK